MAFFEALPWNIIEDIGLHLSYGDVCSLMETCKACYSVLGANHFWFRYLHRNTSLTELDPSLNLRLLFQEHLRGRFKRPAVEMGVVWLNGHYLSKEAYADSLTGEIVVLHSVCWLDLSTTFTDVDPGQYKVIWRMKAERGLNIDGTTTFCTTWDGGKVQFSLERHEWNRPSKNSVGTFSEYHVGFINVEKRSDVKLHMFNHSGSWKSGISWDYVQLRPIVRNRYVRKNSTKKSHDSNNSRCSSSVS